MSNQPDKVGAFFAHMPGFFCAILAASIWFTVQTGVTDWVSGVASSQPMPDRLWQIATQSLLVGVVFAVLAFVLAGLPLGLSIAVARNLKATHLSFYVLSAIIVAIAISPLVAWILPYDDMTDLPQSYRERCVMWSMKLIGPSVSAAAAFWWGWGRSMNDEARIS